MSSLKAIWESSKLVKWAAALAMLFVLARALPPIPERETVIRYVDERGNTVSKETAEAYLAEQARLEAIEKEALTKYAAEKAAKEAVYSPTYYPAPVTDGGASQNRMSNGFSGTGVSNDRVQVDGYYRRDGTYVRPHYRSAGNSTERDNWGTKGNTNPTNGRRGSQKARR